jgi:hypothetical protein
MKSIKDLREDYNLITEKEEHDMNKLTQLVRAGLFDAKKLSALKRAMDKPADKMTAQEKRMMINLLDSLMAEVLSDKQVYSKIKRDVMKEAKSWETKDYLSKNDPRFGRGFPDQKDMPSVLLLKRKGIRVFPDGQKIGLYYAQAIDKYVSIPFQDINISEHSVNEETQLNELGLRDMVGGIADFLSGGDNEESKKKEPKYLKPGEAGKTKLNVGGPEKERDDDRPDVIRSRMASMNRDFMNAQAKSSRNVRESFMGKLEVLRELSGKEAAYLEYLDSLEQKTDDKNKQGTKKPPKADAKPPKVDAPVRPAVKPPSLFGKALSVLGKAAAEISLPYTVATTLGKGSKITPDSEKGKKFSSYIKTKQAEKSSQAQNWPGAGTTGLGPKADSKGTSAFTGMPTKSAPAKAKLPQAPKDPNNAGITTINKPDEGAEREVDRKMKSDQLDSAKSGVTTAKDLKTSTNAGQKNADKADQKIAQQTKPDEEGTGKRETESGKPSRPGLAALLPGLALGGVKGKPLTPGPAKLSLNVSGPKREGDPSAIASRTSSLEREMLKAQSKLRESVDLDGNLFELNSKEAKKVTALYESLNTKNKKKMVEAMNESAESLEKVISFAVRQ